MSQLIIKRYNPSIDEMVDVDQNYFDLLDYKLFLIAKIMRCQNVEVLKEMQKVSLEK